MNHTNTEIDQSENSRGLLDELNPPQWEAVQHREGPLLILAGAGSGKTRVITSRIAHLILEGAVEPDRIVAMTFTNKAADEMHERVAAILERNGGGEDAGGPTISTFHSLGARLLRWHGDRLGLDWSFTILDQDDQMALVKEVAERHDFDLDHGERKQMRRYIEEMKNDGLVPRQAHELTRTQEEEEAAEFYEHYQRQLRANNCADFGDLLLAPLELFRDDPDLAARYSWRWQQVMVDEFQDTNPAQYELLGHLCVEHSNVTVVGDDDQAIYRWRGATVANILDFEEDFEDTEVVKLEQNYRSSQLILDAAHDVIQHNPRRRDKKLWTTREGGEPITVFTGDDDREEAQFVARRIEKLVRGGQEYRDFAVFYRTNAQSRQFEEKLRARGIPYRVVGGTSFYGRAEIKDVLAYLQVAMNPSDDVSLLRVIGTPSRGVGGVTVEKLRRAAEVPGVDSLFGAVRYAAGMEERSGIGLGRIEPKPRHEGDWEALAELDDLGGRPKGGVREFGELIVDIREEIVDGERLSEMVAHLIDRLNYFEHLDKKDAERARDRKENVHELIVAMRDYEDDEEAEPTPMASPLDEDDEAEEMAAAEAGLLADSTVGAQLRGFLERTSLVRDNEDDEGDEDGKGGEGGGLVTLMTVHGAKGLEFDTVFMVGMEDDLFPNVRDSSDREELHEERRLAYVAITRAERKLYVTNAKRRRLWGRVMQTEPSRFLLDIDEERLELDPRSSADKLEYRRRRNSRFGRGRGGSGWASSSESGSFETDYSWDQSVADGNYDEPPDEGEGFDLQAYGEAVAEASEEGADETYFSQVNPEADEAAFVDEGWEEQSGAASSGAGGGGGDNGDDRLVGATVSHSRFGIGRIIAVSGSGDDAKLTIDFPQGGEQTVIRKWVKILG